MALNKACTYGESENILDSEVGLVTKTKQATKAMAGSDNIIKAGALFSQGADPAGVVFEDYDMEDYDELPIAVVVQGRLKADKVSAEALAQKEAFVKQGLYLV